MSMPEGYCREMGEKEGKGREEGNRQWEARGENGSEERGGKGIFRSVKLSKMKDGLKSFCEGRVRD